jgi:predicted ATPase
MLPPRAMLQRLTSRLKLLTGGARDLPERQRTLRATIEWSFALLDEGEQVHFARLAVFFGGRTLEAIKAICDAEGDLPVDAFEGVSSLLDKSLLRQEEGPGGEPRFVMLETVHEFAREKLEESAEAEFIKHAHAEYFLTLAEEAHPELKGAKQLEWLERLEAEHRRSHQAHCITPVQHLQPSQPSTPVVSVSPSVPRSSHRTPLLGWKRSLVPLELGGAQWHGPLPESPKISPSTGIKLHP